MGQSIGRAPARAAIVSADINDGIITSAHIAVDTVVATDIAPNAVTASELADDAVVNASVASGAAIAVGKLAGTASRALETDSSGAVQVSAITTTELAKLDGITSSAVGISDSQTLTNKTLTTPAGIVKGDVGLGNVDNTTDALKPVSTAATTALALKAPKENPTFTGAATIPSIKQTDAQTLSGTYTTHEMIMGKTFTLNGNLTVNDNLVLCNLSGTGSDITIQPDSTARTITGTGTLGGGEMLGNTPQRTSVTGMTGTLESGIIFPAGHIIQVVQGTDRTATTHTSSTYTNLPYQKLNTSIVPKYSTSKILVMLNASVAHYGPGGDTHHVKLQRNPAGVGGGTVDIGVGTPVGSLDGATFSMRLAETHSMMHQNINYLDSPATTSGVTYGITGRRNAGAGVAAYNMPENTSTTDTNMSRHVSIITLMEIAQ